MAPQKRDCTPVGIVLGTLVVLSSILLAWMILTDL